MPSENSFDFDRLMLSIWQYNVGKFLLSHKRYRIFFWKFGPTLLEHLNNRNRRDYAEYALFLTYCVMVTSAITLRNRKLIAIATTCGVTVLGIVSMTLVDYFNTVRGEGVIDDERCFKLLQDLGKMPKYWWCPWGPKIEGITMSDAQKAGMFIEQSFFWKVILSTCTNVAVNQLRIEQHKHLYDYQQLKREKEVGNTQSNELVSRDKSGNMFRSVIANYDGNNVSLGQTLKSFDLSWLLMKLDISIQAVEGGARVEKSMIIILKR